MIKQLLAAAILITTAFASDEVEELDLSYNDKLTRVDFLREYPNLIRLNLYGCHSLKDRYKPVSELTELTELRLSNIGLTKTKYLLPLQKLTILDLSGNTGFRSLKYVIQITSITRFNLSGNKQIKDLSVLKKLPNLLHLEFEYILMDLEDDDSIFEPIGELKNLRKLNIGHNTYLRNIRFLEGLRRLEMLDVTHDQCIRNWDIIGELDQLTKLKMAGTAQYFIPYVTKLTELGKLVIDRNVQSLDFRTQLRKLGDLIIL